MNENPSGSEVLDDAVTDVITRIAREWDLDTYQAIGVLAVISARLAHKCVVHEGEDEE